MSLKGFEITLINSLFNKSAHNNEGIPPTQLERWPETNK